MHSRRTTAIFLLTILFFAAYWKLVGIWMAVAVQGKYIFSFEESAWKGPYLPSTEIAAFYGWVVFVLALVALVGWVLLFISRIKHRYLDTYCYGWFSFWLLSVVFLFALQYLRRLRLVDDIGRTGSTIALVLLAVVAVAVALVRFRRAHA